MKRFCTLLSVILLLLTLSCCTDTGAKTQIVTTTLPVYNFTEFLCNGTGIQVTRLFEQNLSCLHDYTLQISQMRALESADMIVLSGAGLENAISSILPTTIPVIDSSKNVELHHMEECAHEHEHAHETDPHIWLSPEIARVMAQNICEGRCREYPQFSDTFQENLAFLEKEFDDLALYATTQLSNLHCRKIITFHDGFSYMAEAFDLEILHAIEEESGSEASASELIELISLVSEHNLPAVFTEINGSPAAASIISAETGVPVFSLDMAMSTGNYFYSMRYNIDTLKEALE